MDLSVHEKWYHYCPNCKTDLRPKVFDGRPRLSCPNCRFIFWNNPKPVVSVLLEKDGKVLMLQRANEPLKGYWCLPGGYLNYDEAPPAAAIREAQEEIGADLELGELVGVYRIEDDPRGINIDLIYAGQLKGDVTLSYEHSNHQLFLPTDLPEQIAYKHRQAIEDWLSKQST